MKTQGDFQSAAVAVLAELPEPSDKPADQVADPENQVEESVDDSQVEQETAPDKGDGDPDQPDESEEKPEDKPADQKKVDFAALAKKKAADRARKQQEDAQAQELAEARALIAAKKKGDAIGLLAAAGIPWKKAAEQVIGGEEKEDPVEPKPDEKLSALQKEVEELKAERIRAQRQSKMAEVLDQTRKMTKADGSRFAFVEEFDAHQEAVDFVDQYVRETGELPGEDLDESLEIGLEHVEKQYAEEAEARIAKLQKALTRKKTGNKNTPKQEVPSAASKSGTKTLTNSTGSGPQLRSEKTKAKSDDDYRRAAALIMPDVED